MTTNEVKNVFRYAKEHLYEKWIRANNVEEIEFEEIKTINNDKRTNLETGLPANDLKRIGYGSRKE